MFRDGWLGGLSNTHQAPHCKRTVAKKTNGEVGTSESSDLVCSRCRTSCNRKEVNYHARETKVWARITIVFRNNGNFLKGTENENKKKSK